MRSTMLPALAVMTLATLPARAAPGTPAVPGARPATAVQTPRPDPRPDEGPNAPKAARPRLDVAFVLDTTGSMGDEIDVVKEQLVSIARRLSAGQPAPDVRFAVVPYKDRGDEYVVRTFPFERDIQKVQRTILSLYAAGGGDERESVSAALHAALKLDWDPAPAVARVAFLVADAGNHSYDGEAGWEHAVTMLRERKIAVHSIGCSGLAADARAEFKSIAERTHGEFEELTYSRVVALEGGRKATVLSSGGATYVAEKELSADEWKKGADRLLAEGKVKKDESGLFAGGGVATGRAASARMADLPAAAPMAEPSPLRNNLDEEIAGKLMKAAESTGVSFR